MTTTTPIGRQLGLHSPEVQRRCRHRHPFRMGISNSLSNLSSSSLNHNRIMLIRGTCCSPHRLRPCIRKRGLTPMNPNTNIPHSQEWGTPPAFAHGAAANHWGAPDANGYVQQQVHQPQQQQQQYYYPPQQYQQPQQYAQYPGPHQQYPHQPMQHVSPSVPSSAPSSAMPTSASPSVAGSGPTTSSGDRVHLPPLRGAHGSPVLANQTTSSPDVNASGSSGVVAAQTAPAVIQLRSSSRGDYTNGSGAPAGGHRQSDSTGSAGGRERDMDRDELENREWERERDQRERERERERDQRDMRERERARDGTQGGGRERDGKKNPLNIRSIISSHPLWLSFIFVVALYSSSLSSSSTSCLFIVTSCICLIYTFRAFYPSLPLLPCCITTSFLDECFFFPFLLCNVLSPFVALFRLFSSLSTFPFLCSYIIFFSRFILEYEQTIGYSVDVYVN
ncbi:hypothetical protein CPC08DRAFT_533394 [Agrocybe pediades]|nr:hypothetical protein CPC08DRAFT_533394 [Agrocybe pediades]